MPTFKADDFDSDSDSEVSSNNLDDTPVSNSNEVPLFSGEDRKNLKSISYLKITKLDNPDSGYKGQVPISSTLETISQVFGNGIYNIEACNHKHKTLRTIENLKINIPITKALGPVSSSGTQLSNQSSQMEYDRIERLALKASESDKELTTKHMELLKSENERATSREREFMSGMIKHQETFFGSMMAMQNQQFQQTIAMMTASHNQTLQIITASHKNDTNPVDLLREGMQLAHGFMDDEDEDEELTPMGILSGGMKLLSQVKDKELSSGNQGQGQGQGASPISRMSPAQASAIKEGLIIRKELRKRGIDIRKLLVEHDTASNDSEPTESESNSESEEPSESSETDTDKDN